MEQAHDRDGAAPTPVPAAPQPAAPSGARAQLIGMQQAAGNQAVVAMLRRSHDDDAVRRETTGTATATPPADSAASASAPAPAPAAVELTEDDRAAMADPNAYLRAAGGRWDEIRKRYKAGKLGFKAGGDAKGKVLDGAKGMNALLAFRLQATVLKKKDGGDASPIEAILPQVQAEAKRQRDEQQAALDAAGVGTKLPPPTPLDWNYGAGSGTATSDIDVNLSGDATEFAVSTFNALFRTQWGGKESGTVFDVNVYARDYLPETGAYSLIQAHEKVEADKATGKAGPKALDQGSKGWEERGVKFETSLTKGSATAKGAASSQEVFSLLKTRKDMGFVDWQRFKAEQLAAFGTDTVARDAKAAAFTKAEAMHQGREAEVAAKIAELDATAKTLLDASKKKGEPAPAADSDADKRLKAENALYERNLQAVAAKRSELIIAKASLASGRASVADIDRLSAELREALHKAAMYGNEAYITGATVLHVVGNLQLLKGSEDISIELSAEDYLASANEQVGFIFDDFHREGGQVEAGLLKAGKYISRLGHAAGKVEAQVTQALAGRGMVHKPLANPSSSQVQKYGEELMRIKEKVAPADQKTALGSAAAGGWTLSGKGLQQVKTELLQFQSKVQALGGKL